MTIRFDGTGEIRRYTTFGKKLFDIRRANNEVLYDMAKRLGYTSSELSKIQLGYVGVPINMIEKLKQAYGLHDDYVQELWIAALYDSVTNQWSKEDSE